MTTRGSGPDDDEGGDPASPAGLAPFAGPPYIAVIFTSTLADSQEGYAEAAARMDELARGRSGFLGMESVREGRLGITVSYWRDEAAVAEWRRDAEHVVAQERGRGQWYGDYRIRVARVEREYGGS
jgi:heme-degrading monooxygenase HmoA